MAVGEKIEDGRCYWVGRAVGGRGLSGGRGVPAHLPVQRSEALLQLKIGMRYPAVSSIQGPLPAAAGEMRRERLQEWHPKFLSNAPASTLG